MRAFTCPDCAKLVVFESFECLRSQTALAFDWSTREMSRLRDGTACANRELASCNGLAEGSGYCLACALTRTRPADGDDSGRAKFIKAELAKRRLVFELLEIGLPVVGYRARPGGLAFDLLNSDRGPVTTGHDDGLITLDLAEADDAHREQMRVELAEPYRTLLGHMRHEIAHYYEPILCPQDSSQRARYRELFGDERADYQLAMDRYYDEGPPADWPSRFVSAYAAMHPWEDWAETSAHYLHIRDTLQTSIAYGVVVAGPSVATAEEAPLFAYPAAAGDGVQGLLAVWLPLTYALNALNRSMGANDLYPFVIPEAVVAKLGFIDGLIRDTHPASFGGYEAQHAETPPASRHAAVDGGGHSGASRTDGVERRLG